jgi:hypothetical protein
MEWSTTFTQADTPQFLLKPAILTQKKLEIAKCRINIWNLLALSVAQDHHGHPLCTSCPQRMGLGSLVVIIAALI